MKIAKVTHYNVSSWNFSVQLNYWANVNIYSFYICVAPSGILEPEAKGKMCAPKYMFLHKS